MRACAELPKLCEFFHIPFQSGDNDILREMRCALRLAGPPRLAGEHLTSYYSGQGASIPAWQVHMAAFWGSAEQLQ